MTNIVLAQNSHIRCDFLKGTESAYYLVGNGQWHILFKKNYGNKIGNLNLNEIENDDPPLKAIYPFYLTIVLVK